MKNFRKILRALMIKVPPKKLIKGTALITFAPALITFAFYYNGLMQVNHAISFMVAIFILAIIFIYPYLRDLSELTNYVSELSKDNKPKKPELSFLNNVEELSQSLSNLNESWEEKKLFLQALITEDKILINSLPDIIIMLNNELKPLQTNKAAKEVLGELRYEFGIMQLLDNPKIADSITQVHFTGKGEIFEFNLGEPFYLDFIIKIEKFPINSPNNIAVVLILQNITEQKRTERLLSDFVANASHEIRTPLASISGFLETMLELETEPEMQRKFLQIMQEQSGRIEKLVSDLLTLSNIQSGSGKYKYETINLNEAIDKAVSALDHSAKNKNIVIKRLSFTSKNQIEGNFDEISRVFDNLVSNAIKYSPDGSEIVITTEDSYNSILKNSQYKENQRFIKVSVKDNGEGISANDIPRLTERFFRVDKARSSKVAGTGLGLAIVKHIIDNHGAELKIESEPGKGSTFSVFFPV